MANIPIIMLNHNCDHSVVYVKEGEQIVEGKFWNSNPRPSEYQSEFSGKSSIKSSTLSLQTAWTGLNPYLYSSGILSHSSSGGEYMKQLQGLSLSTSGNRSPNSRFYSDLLDTSVCIHQLVLNCRLKGSAARIIVSS